MKSPQEVRVVIISKVTNVQMDLRIGLEMDW